MKFTKIPENTFQHLQLNAGVLLRNFDPASAEVDKSDIIGATSGGVSFSAVPTYSDLGDDIDNCPKNMLELKNLDSWVITLGGSFVTVDSEAAKLLIAAADVSENKITPRNDITEADFGDIWWVGDYSDKNGDKNGGYITINMMNALSTGGFSLQTRDRAKGTFAFSFTAHYCMTEQEKVPFEVFIKAGTEEA